MAPSYPFNHFSHRALDEGQVLSYLERLRLPLDLLKQRVRRAKVIVSTNSSHEIIRVILQPSYGLLDQLFIAHLERVAKVRIKIGMQPWMN